MSSHHPMNGQPMYPGTRWFGSPFAAVCESCNRPSNVCVRMDVDNGNCTDRPFETWTMVLCPQHKAEAIRLARRDGSTVYDQEERISEGRLLNRREVNAIRDRFAGEIESSAASATERPCSVCGGHGVAPSGHLCPFCDATGVRRR